MRKQSGLFDEEMRLRKLSELGDSLEKLGCIDWEIFRPIIRSAFDKKGKSKAGRPTFDYVMLFKILVLQRFYNISDEQPEIKVPETRVSEIVRGKRAVTADTAIRLAKFFGTTAEFWLNLHNLYDLEEENNHAKEFEMIKMYAYA